MTVFVLLEEKLTGNGNGNFSKLLEKTKRKVENLKIGEMACIHVV